MLWLKKKSYIKAINPGLKNIRQLSIWQTQQRYELLLVPTGITRVFKDPDPRRSQVIFGSPKARVKIWDVEVEKKILHKKIAPDLKNIRKSSVWQTITEIWTVSYIYFSKVGINLSTQLEFCTRLLLNQLTATTLMSLLAAANLLNKPFEKLSINIYLIYSMISMICNRVGSRFKFQDGP